MGVHRVFLSFLLFSLISSLQAQVIIKESMVIDPRPHIEPLAASVPSGPLLRLNGARLETTMPGVIVTGSLSVTPATLPDNTAFEVWVNVGGSAHLLRKSGTGYCVDTIAHESSPFPATLEHCGSIGMDAKTFVPAPWQWSCTRLAAGIDTPAVSGNSATITARGSLWTTELIATLTVTASLDESYLPSQIVATPQSDSLSCNGFSVVDVTLLNGLGDVFSDCAGGQLTGTATVQANGEYAFLEGNGQSGKSISFNILNGRGAFLVVLDTARGVIDGGYDEASINVQVDDVTGSASVGLRCDYPPPSVAITSPEEGATFTLSPDDPLILVFAENHSPAPGEQFEPAITWEPGPTLNTSAYYGQIQDSLVIPIKVTATNAGGTATDERHITLKKGCNLMPPRYAQGDARWGKETYDSTAKPVSALGCALSSMAMAMTAFGDTVDPGEMNTWMKARGRYKGGFVSSSVNWDAILRHSSKAILYEYHENSKLPDTSKATDLTLLDSDIDNCSLVIAQVYNSKTSNQHWVVIKGKANGTYNIVDPGRGETTLTGYGNRVWKYLVVTSQ